MKYGKAYTYNEVEDAKKLIGKNVLASDSLLVIKEDPVHAKVVRLVAVTPKISFPFEVHSAVSRFYQFIREIIEKDEPEPKPKQTNSDQMPKYDIVMGSDLFKLKRGVNEVIEYGYEPFGGIFTEEDGYYCQAMVKI